MPALVDPQTGNYLTARNRIPYIEFGEFNERYGDGEHIAQRLCGVSFGQKDAFIADMLPDVALQDYEIEQRFSIVDIDGNPTNFIRQKFIRYDPEAHPRREHLFAQQCEVVEGMGWPGRDATNQMHFYTTSDVINPSANPYLPPGVDETYNNGLAKILVTYRNLPYKINVATNPYLPPGAGGTSNEICNASGSSEIYRYVQRQRAPSGESLPLPQVSANLFRWSTSPGTPVQTQGIVRLQSKIHLIYTWYMVPKIPTTCFRMFSQVNSLPFDAENDVFSDPGTGAVVQGRSPFPTTRVQYIAAEITKEYQTFSGVRVVDINYHFLVRPHRGGHLAFLRPSTFQYERIHRPNGGTIELGDTIRNGMAPGVFEVGDLHHLFRIDK